MKIKNLKDLEKFIKKKNLFGLLGVNKIGVFGSFARNEKFKDIDLLIEDEVNLESLISFQKILRQNLDVPVDIVLSKYAEPIILYRAQQDLKYAKC